MRKLFEFYLNGRLFHGELAENETEAREKAIQHSAIFCDRLNLEAPYQFENKIKLCQAKDCGTFPFRVIATN